MLNSSSGRSNGSIGKKLEKFVLCRRAQRLCYVINREMASIEARYLRQRPQRP